MAAHERNQLSVRPTHGSQPSGRPVVISDDDIADMLRFATKWLAFGGGHELDIFMEFGTPASEFYRRLAVILRRRPGIVPSDIDRHELLRLCSLRSIR